MYPGIEVNSYYRQMNQAPDSQELKEYLGNKIRQAEWVKQCITQRSKTMMDVSRVILERQEAFFSHGPNYLKPLRMTDIAEILGIHESTVSRAVSKKYLQCSWGVYPMNFFFSRNVGTSTSSTEKSDDPSKAVTARKIKQLLHEIIAEENKKEALQRPPSWRKADGKGDLHLPPHRCKIPGRRRNSRCQRPERIYLI